VERVIDDTGGRTILPSTVISFLGFEFSKRVMVLGVRVWGGGVGWGVGWGVGLKIKHQYRCMCGFWC